VVGIALISHSRSLAEGALELAEQIGSMAGSIAAAGGTDDGRLGTSIDQLAAAVRKVQAGAGVLIIPDLGSSVLTARTYLEEEGSAGVLLADAPFVEGAVAAAVMASTGAPLAAVAAAAEEARSVRKL
jgi:PTS hybrid protein